MRNFLQELYDYVKYRIKEQSIPISTEEWIKYLSEKTGVSEYYVANGYQYLRSVAYWIYQAWELKNTPEKLAEINMTEENQQEICKWISEKDFSKLKEILNKNLPSSIKVLKISKVKDDFHSRFHAKKRVYRYLITTKPTTPFNDKFITHIKNINEELLQKAIKEFVGVYDFKYFHKTGSDKELTKREIFDTKFYKYKDIYVFKFTANSYLRSQIRLMVGFLLAINDNKQSIENLKEQLTLQKHHFKTPAVANGLYLAKIKY